MTKSLLARTALLASAPLLLASAQPMMMPPVDNKVAELRDAALYDEMAWDILKR